MTVVLLLSVDPKAKLISLWDSPKKRSAGAQNHERFLNLLLTEEQSEELIAALIPGYGEEVE